MLIDLNTSQLDRIKINQQLQAVAVKFLINNIKKLKPNNLVYYIRSNIYLLSLIFSFLHIIISIITYYMIKDQVLLCIVNIFIFFIMYILLISIYQIPFIIFGLYKLDYITFIEHIKLLGNIYQYNIMRKIFVQNFIKQLNNLFHEVNNAQSIYIPNLSDSYLKLYNNISKTNILLYCYKQILTIIIAIIIIFMQTHRLPSILYFLIIFIIYNIINIFILLILKQYALLTTTFNAKQLV